MRHLTDQEFVKLYTDGPEKLMQHSDEFAHMHIVHEGCVVCLLRLVALIELNHHSLARNVVNN